MVDMQNIKNTGYTAGYTRASHQSQSGQVPETALLLQPQCWVATTFTACC